MVLQKVGNLEKKLQKKGFSNLSSPPFDLSNEEVDSTYQQFQEFIGTNFPETSSQSSSWEKITAYVNEHVSKHGDDSLIIISGESTHIWGAIPELEQTVNARYVSTTPRKLDVDWVMNEDISIPLFDNSNEERRESALYEIEKQIIQDLSLVRSLGYDNIEEFMAERSQVQNPMNLVFGIETPPSYKVLSMKNQKKLYSTLLKFMEKEKPTSVLYLGQNLDIGQERRCIEECADFPVIPPARNRDMIYDEAFVRGIPIEVGSFGTPDICVDVSSNLAYAGSYSFGYNTCEEAPSNV